MIQNDNQNGNAFWFVLLAVTLLATLTITVTRSSDTSEQSGDIERLRVYTTTLLRYAAGVEQAVEQMRMRGLSENEISFENSFVSGYTNTVCGEDRCKVFHAEGGGINYTQPLSDITSDDWLFTGANSIAGVGTDGTGETSNADNELLMILPGVSAALCARINTELDIAGVPQDTDRVNVSTLYTGSFINGRVIEAPSGERTGCFQGNQDNAGVNISDTHYFFHTLIER